MIGIGIVGLLNVGKFILFNVIIKVGVVEVVNYFFCIIESNVGVVIVLDERLNEFVKIINF